MRKTLIGGVMLAVGVSTLVLAPSASASDTIVTVTKTYPADQYSSLPAALCGFPIDITVIKNQETDITTTVKKKDGTLVSTTHPVFGPLVLTFTNQENGKSFTRDLSGTTVDVLRADGTETFVGVGNNWLGFGPIGQTNIGEPGLVIARGPVKATFSGNTAQTFALHGTQENGCALLTWDDYEGSCDGLSQDPSSLIRSWGMRRSC